MSDDLDVVDGMAVAVIKVAVGVVVVVVEVVVLGLAASRCSRV